jgi:hypothetical protein
MEVTIGPINRALQSNLYQSNVSKEDTIMHATTVAKVTLLILIAILLLMIRNVFAFVEYEPLPVHMSSTIECIATDSVIESC